jgi:hypothetical protein
MLRNLVVLVLVALVNGGCALLGGARVEAVATSVQKPSNVTMLVSVTEGDEPVTGLEPQNFNLYENEQELSPDQVKRTLIERSEVTAQRVVLLVELTGEPNSPDRQRLQRAIEVFVEKVRPELGVTVFAYDGSESLRAVGEYPKGSGAVSAAALATLPSPDGSRNLYGAVVDGVRQLDVRLSGDKRAARLGTLVVLSRGPDLAARMTEDRMAQVLESVRFDVIGIGVGEDTRFLGFARSGVIKAQNADTVPIAFTEAATRVLQTHGKYYVIAYCSPARAGQRSLRLEVKYVAKSGDERGGSVTHDFDATGFGPGCNPQTPPRFERAAPPSSASTAAPGTPAAPATPAPNEGPAVNRAPESGSGGDVVPPPSGSGYTP